MCHLRLALLFYCGCMLLLIFIYLLNIRWKRKYLVNKSQEVCLVPEKKLFLSTGVGWRVLEKLSLHCSGDGDGWKYFWTTVEVEYLDLDIADDIANISSSLMESYASSPRSQLWPVMLFRSHFGNPNDFNFRTVVLLAEWFDIFLFSQMVSHYSS